MRSTQTGRVGLAAGGLTLVAAAVAAAALLTGGAGAGVNLTVEKSDSPDPVQTGQVLTYAIEVTNVMPGSANDVRVEDKLPNSVRFLSATAGCERQGRTVTCELGTLASGESATVEIRVRPRKARTISNKVEVFMGDLPVVQASDTETTRVTEGPSCAGRAPTIVGTPGHDEIMGTPGADVIVTFGGGDEVDGLGGKDRICGGRGGDRLRGGDGNDIVKGARGPDVVKGARGNDRVTGANGRDKVRGGGGDDTVRGGRKRDKLRGGGGNDLLNGGRDRDRCNGGPGNDTLLKCES